ncbi:MULTISPECIES: Os1348 family NHLP clan protein [Amycolatopsis]|uniref:Uncharacterized protein n=1 Tax=Amycolatopsis bullii TaxID=941987 RepID=A0ABQ3KCG1_9PSEU|nr:Os1348 family NHLP clan protein [Amycolatopsis bullii]GHG12160.1 hypothetical protein GCM10017567_31930 [Amycolatopsis bullii]
MTEALEISRSSVGSGRAVVTIDALIGRLSYDEEFAKNLATSPRETLEEAGLSFDKEEIDFMMQTDPQRFDAACEALFNLVDGNFLYSITMPSCDT